MGDEKAGGRRRAVGTRDRVMSHLLMVGEVKDASGMASTALAEAIAYPGSSIAFAQLLSGMERSGLIEREIRGKRTYRISPAQVGRGTGPDGCGAAAPGPAVAGQGRPGGRGAKRRGKRRGIRLRRAGAAAAAAGRAAARHAAGGRPGATGAAPGRARTASARTAMSRSPGPWPAWSRSWPASGPTQQRLTEENAELREQLRAAQESLAQAQERAAADPAAVRLDSAEIRLLERLLSPLRDKGPRQEEAGAG